MTACTHYFVGQRQFYHLPLRRTNKKNLEFTSKDFIPYEKFVCQKCGLIQWFPNYQEREKGFFGNKKNGLILSDSDVCLNASAHTDKAEVVK